MSKQTPLSIDRFTTVFNFDLTSGSERKNRLLVVGFFSDTNKEIIDYDRSLISDKLHAVSIVSEKKTIYVCLGKAKSFNKKVLFTIAHTLTGLRRYQLDFDLKSFTNQSVSQGDVFDIFARSWYYLFHSPLQHKSNFKPEPKTHFHLLTTIAKSETILAKIKTIFQAVSFCRNLQDEAPNVLHSEAFAKLMSERFESDPKVACQILDREGIVKEQMNLLLAVNAGSQYEPRVVVLKYHGDPTNPKQTTVLLGKGITFDTGGYSLKPSNYQLGMKFDMSGAAIVISTLAAISELQLKVNVVAIACLTDNAIGSKATLVESVIKSKSGKTVEITNTDAEGRLVLADGIAYALEHIKPTQIIELSTLTGAISVTLGDWMSGVFVNPKAESLYLEILKSATKVNEKIWRLPVTEENVMMMKSPIADLVNANKGYKGGSSNAAAFLFQFAGKTPFIHFDIAGTATKPENTFGTGVMIQTLVQYFQTKSK